MARSISAAALERHKKWMGSAQEQDIDRLCVGMVLISRMMNVNPMMKIER
ncbi:MAG TPA: hypothetical protein VF463_12170 [Sphingobium sp.]